jgi:predicted Zn-dependent protease
MSRRERLEEMLAENPEDPFLRYGLAMEDANEGRADEALKRLRALIEDQAGYVPAYFQAGQLLVQSDRIAEAREMLRGGIAAAQQAGDAHAVEEMGALLAELPES